MRTKPKLLLHVCCGVCSAYIPERLLPDYDVTVYFENSNLYPSEEFYRRRDAADQIATAFNLPFLTASYQPKLWYHAVRGLAMEPERGKRCTQCVAFRLDQTFRYAKAHGFGTIATTLTVSRRKNTEEINALGNTLAEHYGLLFLERDWKKENGEKRSQENAKAAGIYRQKYCGCVYSFFNSKYKNQK